MQRQPERGPENLFVPLDTLHIEEQVDVDVYTEAEFFAVRFDDLATQKQCYREGFVSLLSYINKKVIYVKLGCEGSLTKLRN
jgi:hypothetical protein